MKNFFCLIALLFIACNSFAQTPRGYNDLIREAQNFYANKSYKRSAETYTRAFRANGWNAYHADRYDAACAWTLSGNKDSAFYQLFKVAGTFKYDNYDRISGDSVLTSLSRDQRWGELLDIVKQNIGKDEAKLNKALLRLMDSVYHDDQAYRFQQIGVNKEFGASSPEGEKMKKLIHEKDSLNGVIVSGLLDNYGWIGKEVIGINGNATLGLVLQHSSLETQLKYLPMMREAVKSKKADAYDLALLEDVALRRQGKKQLYGTFVASAAGKIYYSAPMEDPENVDKRRAEIGLGPLDEYLRNWGIRWNIKKYEEDLKLYDK